MPTPARALGVVDSLNFMRAVSPGRLTSLAALFGTVAGQGVQGGAEALAPPKGNRVKSARWVPNLTLRKGPESAIWWLTLNDKSNCHKQKRDLLDHADLVIHLSSRC